MFVVGDIETLSTFAVTTINSVIEIYYFVSGILHPFADASGERFGSGFSVFGLDIPYHVLVRGTEVSLCSLVQMVDSSVWQCLLSFVSSF